MRKQISINGIGAVSPAGWGVTSLINAIEQGETIPTSYLSRMLGEEEIRTPVFRVPAEGATTPKFARLRRASPISKFAAAAVAEALGDQRLAEIAAGNLRVGVIFTLTNGCVNYSSRFYGEALTNPSLASPILFPETVFNAPSSHLSALMGSTSPNDTLIADSTGFISGIDLAIEWIERDDVDGCIVVSAEEIDWLSAEGLRYYSRGYVASEGAAAVYLESRSDAESVRILRLPDPVSLSFTVGSKPPKKSAKSLLLAMMENAPRRWLLWSGSLGSPRNDYVGELVRSTLVATKAAGRRNGRLHRPANCGCRGRFEIREISASGCGRSWRKSASCGDLARCLALGF
ncbi:MAG: hypothetical protein HC845_02460 [Akkermansiaceae bacterium]|nr:hypothetical protein [Akkermansiaceae bacterium]